MATTLATMRQLEERQVEIEVKLLEWSPKMDILAVGLFNGEVSLYRLNWQKIWTVSPPEECSCEAFVWRPDGKVLAAGYSNGEIYILDIENNIPSDKSERNIITKRRRRDGSSALQVRKSQKSI